MAGPVAVLATLSAVAVGVLTTTPSIPGTEDLLASSSSATAGISAGAAPRGDVVSRSERREDARQEAKQDARQQARRQAQREERQQARQARERARREASQQATLRAVRAADTRLWTTTELNLWSSAAGDARNTGLLDDLEKVLVTGRKVGDRTEVVVDGTSRWVTAGYLSEEKPRLDEPAAERGIGGACTNGTSVSGSANVIGVHRAVCAAFPDLTSYGTYRSDGEHAQGIAIDIMVSGDYGWQVAEFLRSHYSELNISYLMYSQKIWSVERGGEGWRYVSDRGSATANHYDHVHVTTY